MQEYKLSQLILSLIGTSRLVILLNMIAELAKYDKASWLQPPDKQMEEELNSFLLNWIREIQLATKTATQSELERENHHDHSVIDTRKMKVKFM